MFAAEESNLKNYRLILSQYNLHWFQYALLSSWGKSFVNYFLKMDERKILWNSREIWNSKVLILIGAAIS